MSDLLQFVTFRKEEYSVQEVSAVLQKAPFPRPPWRSQLSSAKGLQHWVNGEKAQRQTRTAGSWTVATGASHQASV